MERIIAACPSWHRIAVLLLYLIDNFTHIALEGILHHGEAAGLQQLAHRLLSVGTEVTEHVK
jgi:hypothetical protein